MKHAFKDVTLGDVYTLVEQYYAETRHWHFDKKPIDSAVSREAWNQHEIQ